MVEKKSEPSNRRSPGSARNSPGSARRSPASARKITEFHVQPLRWRDVLTTFLPLVVMVLAPLGYGLWRTYYGYTKYGPGAAAAWGRGWFFLSGGLLIFLLLYTLRRLIRAHRRVEVFAAGLKLHAPGRRPQFVPWQEITGLTTTSVRHSFLGWKSKPRQKLTLITRNRGTRTIDHRIRKIGDLIDIVKEQVYPLRLPVLKKGLHQGKTLSFGRIQLSRRGLIVDQSDLPWSYIKGLTTRDGQLIIKLSKQKERRIPVQDIHNIELFIQLIKEEI